MHLRDQGIDRGELLFIANLLQEAHLEQTVVDVFGKVLDVDLDAAVAALKCRVVADVGERGIVPAAIMGRRSVDAVRQHDLGVGDGEVCRREAQRAAAPVAVDDAVEHGQRAAEARLGCGEVPACNQGADARAADGPAAELDGRADLGAEAVITAHALQESVRALAAAAEGDLRSRLR